MLEVSGCAAEYGLLTVVPLGSAVKVAKELIAKAINNEKENMKENYTQKEVIEILESLGHSVKIIADTVIINQPAHLPNPLLPNYVDKNIMLAPNYTSKDFASIVNKPEPNKEGLIRKY